MQSKARTTAAYLAELPPDRKKALSALRGAVLKKLPKGFEETMSYGMIGYVVPHALYPDGYHCDPRQPLPFASLASQKNHISFYHMGLYSDAPLLKWFQEEWKKEGLGKLDMGKGCVRFKSMDRIPHALMGRLCARLTPKQWIKVYEENIRR